MGSVWSIDEVKTYLKRWIEAEQAVATGQSYKIGNRQLVRADLGEIAKRISFWKQELEKLDPSLATPNSRAFRVIPIDL